MCVDVRDEEELKKGDMGVRGRVMWVRGRVVMWVRESKKGGGKAKEWMNGEWMTGGRSGSSVKLHKVNK